MESLQRNDSDFLPFPTSLLLPHVVTPVVAVMQDAAVLASMYKMQADQLKQQTGVLQFIHGFDADAWLTTISFLILFSCLLRTVTRISVSKRSKRSIRRKHRTNQPITDTILLTMAMMVKQAGSFTLPRLLIRKPSIVCLIHVFCFLVSLFLTSMIKTTSVVYRKPAIIDSVKDMLDMGVRPVFAGFDNTLSVLQDAPADSMRGRILKIAENMGLNKSLATADKSMLWQHLLAIEGGKEAAVLGSDTTSMFTAATCALLPVIQEMYSEDTYMRLPTFTWIAEERDEGAWFSNIVMRRDADERLLRIISQRLQVIMQADLPIAVYNDAVNRIIQRQQDMTRMQACMSNTIQYPDIVTDSLDIEHYSGLFVLLLSSGCLVPLFCLTIEVRRKHFQGHTTVCRLNA